MQKRRQQLQREAKSIEARIETAKIKKEAVDEVGLYFEQARALRIASRTADVEHDGDSVRILVKLYCILQAC